MCVERHPQGNRRAAGSSPAGSTLLGLVWLISGITIFVTIIFRIGNSIYPIELINLEGYDFPEEP